MAIIVIGGHSRNVGKTSVVTGLISAFSRCSWTAIKISSHGHRGVFEREIGEIYEEKDRGSSTDTSRFLAAGASRSLWARIGEDNADSVLRELIPILQTSPFVIIESNHILKFIHADLYILVLRCDVEEFKSSAKKTLKQADALVLWNSECSPPAWKAPLREVFESLPVFSAADPPNIPKGLIDFVQSRLAIRNNP